jgi:hypothetical protein
MEYMSTTARDPEPVTIESLGYSITDLGLRRSGGEVWCNKAGLDWLMDQFRSLGAEVDKGDGNLMFHGMPVRYLPGLDQMFPTLPFVKVFSGDFVRAMDATMKGVFRQG